MDQSTTDSFVVVGDGGDWWGEFEVASLCFLSGTRLDAWMPGAAVQGRGRRSAAAGELPGAEGRPEACAQGVRATDRPENSSAPDLLGFPADMRRGGSLIKH